MLFYFIAFVDQRTMIYDMSKTEYEI